MKKAMEGLFYKYHVNAAFSGHVHSYERFLPIFNNVTTNNATIYMTVGAGGQSYGKNKIIIIIIVFFRYEDYKHFHLHLTDCHRNSLIPFRIHAEWCSSLRFFPLLSVTFFDRHSFTPCPPFY